MPHLVQMLDKWSKAGLVVVTVNVLPADLPPDLTRAKYAEQAESILKDNKLRAVNLFLEADEKTLEEKLRIQAYPAIYVFDRAGRWTPFKAIKGGKHVEEKEIERFVEKLLSEK